MYIILHGILFCFCFVVFFMFNLFTIFASFSLLFTYIQYNNHMFSLYIIFLLKFIIQTYTIDHIHLYTKIWRKSKHTFILFCWLLIIFFSCVAYTLFDDFYFFLYWALAVGYFRHSPHLFLFNQFLHVRVTA